MNLPTAATRIMAPLLSLAVITAGCDAGTFVEPEVSGPTHVSVSPKAVALPAGFETRLTAVVTDSSGEPLEGITLHWSSSDAGVATVTNRGIVHGIVAGAAMLVAVAPDGTADTARVTVLSESTTPTVTGALPAADLTEFILGPQVAPGSHPWPQYDEAQMASASKWYEAYMAEGPGGTDYYDLALVLHQLHARTNDDRYFDMAQDVAMAGWVRMPDASDWPDTPSAFAIAPRSTPIAGLTMLALSGADVPPMTFRNMNDPSFSETWELWDWLAEYGRRMNNSWLERWEDSNDGIHSGIRDGGMLLRYLAILARAHPDADVRAEMLDHARTAARDYYADEQLADGSWRWKVGDNLGSTQPFQVGLLLEGLIATHQLTDDEIVGQAIVRAVEAVWRDQIDHNPVPFNLLPGVTTLAAFYRVYGEGCEPPIPQQGGCGNNFDAAGGSFKARNQLRVFRHRNTMVVHAFAYAYRITGDERFRDWGDALFQATFGEPEYPVLNSKGKEYDQAFRSSGRYLGWRFGT